MLKEKVITVLLQLGHYWTTYTNLNLFFKQLSGWIANVFADEALWSTTVKVMLGHPSSGLTDEAFG